MSEAALIERIAARGDGVTADGRHVMGGVPGDRVRDDGIIIPGPNRTEPVCRHFGKCGGCQLQHVAEPALAEFVRDRVVGGLEGQEVRYGDVLPAQNNFCGLGTTGGGVKGAFFATAQLGVRAHIQHLLAYSSTREPSEPVIDPRYQLVRDSYGTRTLGTWEDLNGRWAVPGYTYGQSILSMFRAMLTE